MSRSLGIIGAGRMGQALLGGMLDAGVADAATVVVADAVQAAVDQLAADHGVTGTTDNTAAATADVVLLAVKPQVMGAVLDEVGSLVRADAVVVSIAAGVTTATLDAGLPNGPAIVRVMPNTPALVRRGAAVLAAGPRADEDTLDLVEELVAPLGEVRRLPESSIDAVTALSGSGPAYVFLLAEAMADAGVLVGLSRDDAVALANQTIVGAGEMLVADRGSAAELREAVTSPGGTTAAALATLEQAGFRGAVLDAVRAAAHRATELG